MMEHGAFELVRGRAADLTQRLRSLHDRKQLTVSFVPSHETKFIGYFSSNLNAELASDLGHRYGYLPPERGEQADIVILTSHGLDLSTRLWQLREKVRKDAVIAIWLWDNHLSHLNNYRTALAADFVFPSHAYSAGYLFNPLSVVGAHTPACSAQWTGDEVRRMLGSNPAVSRTHKALVNYVDYPASWRSGLLRELKARVPEAEVLLMPPDDRSRYFSKTSEQRFIEWMQYKATVILPVEKDLSTRVFDALLSGQVPIVPTSVEDFDYVISPQMQKELGIVRVKEVTVDALISSISEALEAFDRMGGTGVTQRQEFVLGHHMLRHRVASMLGNILEMAQKTSIVAGIGKFGFGLYLAPKT